MTTNEIVEASIRREEQDESADALLQLKAAVDRIARASFHELTLLQHNELARFVTLAKEGKLSLRIDTDWPLTRAVLAYKPVTGGKWCDVMTIRFSRRIQ